MRLDLQLRLFSTTKLPVSPGSTAPPRLLRQLDQRLADARPAALHRRRITAHTTTLRCEGGAWGLADRCRHHEGEPLDARGLCRWGRLAEQEQG